MTQKNANKIAILIIVAVWIVSFAVSWGCTVGLVWLLSLCFDFTFTLKLGTGVWLVVLLLCGIGKIVVKVREG